MPCTPHLPANPAPRSPGVHVSGIIRCIATETGILKPEWAEELSLVDASQEHWWAALDPASRLRISIGLAWEEWYLRSLPGVVDHPGEMHVDGIYMTHDGESLDVVLRAHVASYELALHEVKATYKSTKTVGNLETQWMWLAQTKAYCKGLHCLVAYLHVLFLCGDYKYPMRPQLRLFRIEYEQAEIDDNWELMTDYKAHREALERENG